MDDVDDDRVDDVDDNDDDDRKWINKFWKNEQRKWVDLGGWCWGHILRDNDD